MHFRNTRSAEKALPWCNAPPGIAWHCQRIVILTNKPAALLWMPWSVRDTCLHCYIAFMFITPIRCGCAHWHRLLQDNSPMENQSGTCVRPRPIKRPQASSHRLKSEVDRALTPKPLRRAAAPDLGAVRSPGRQRTTASVYHPAADTATCSELGMQILRLETHSSRFFMNPPSLGNQCRVRKQQEEHAPACTSGRRSKETAAPCCRRVGNPFQTFNVKILTNCKGLPARACGRRSREAAAPRRCRRPILSSTSRCLPLRPPRQSPPQPPLQTTKRTLSSMWQLCHAIVLIAQLHDTAQGAGIGALPHSAPYLCLTHRASAHTAAMPAACKREPTPLYVEESHKRSKHFRMIGRNMSEQGQGQTACGGKTGLTH